MSKRNLKFNLLEDKTNVRLEHLAKAPEGSIREAVIVQIIGSPSRGDLTLLNEAAIASTHCVRRPLVRGGATSATPFISVTGNGLLYLYVRKSPLAFGIEEAKSTLAEVVDEYERLKRFAEHNAKAASTAKRNAASKRTVRDAPAVRAAKAKPISSLRSPKGH